MTSFQQIADKSQNLLDDERLSKFSGAVLSPINYLPEETKQFVERLRLRRPGDFDFVLDPQLYDPRSERGVLRKWSYFPSSFESVDRSSAIFWKTTVTAIAEAAKELRVRYVASPADLPKTWTNDYYERLNQVGAMLCETAEDRFVPMQSVIVNLAEIDDATRALKIASIVSSNPCPWVYLIIDASQRETRELNEDAGIVGVMKLIYALEQAGRRVLVAHCSSDVLLWKAAGATACGSGKFFNVRRFSRSRYAPKTTDGGGSADYWFEESLLAFLKQPDLLRLGRDGLLSEATLQNPLLREVNERIKSGQRWLKISWVQFLEWFADVEERLSSGVITSTELLDTAEESWKRLDLARVLLVDRFNDGAWVRRWKQALIDFDRWKSEREVWPSSR